MKNFLNSSVAFFFGISLLLIPVSVFAQVTTVGGGTGTTSPSGILIGVTGNLHLQTLIVGSGLTLTGTTLTSNGGSGTPGGLNLQVQYNNAGSFGGISGAVTNGTILNLTNPLLGGATLTTSVVNGVTLTSAGSATTYLDGTGAYSVPAGTIYTATYPIKVTGTVISSLFSTTSNSGMAQGFQYVGSGGIFQTAASSSLFGFTPQPAGTYVTAVSGTANQITSSGSTAITLSLPNHVIFPVDYVAISGSTTNSTTTNFAITGAATNCNGTNALTTNSSGVVGCTAQPQGTVTSVAVATANGFAGTSSGGATPTLTLTTSITGLLKGNGTAISAAANGTDYTLLSAQSCSAGSFVSALTAAGGSTCTAVSTGVAYPFTPSTFGIAVSATTTPILDYAGLITATSTIGTLVASSSITNQSVKSALVLDGANGSEGAYGGATGCTNQFVTAISAVGGTTCTSLTSGNVTTALGFTPGQGTVTSVGLSDSNSTLTIGSTPVTTSGTITATLNLTHSNTWTATQIFNATPNSALFGSLMGIGTTTPGGTYQEEIASSTGQQLVLSDANVVDNQWAFRNAGGTLYIGTSSPVNYSTSTTQSAIQVTSSATTLFGIATTTPWRTLSVNGTVGFAGLTSAASSSDFPVCISPNNELVNSGSTSCALSSQFVKHDIKPVSSDTAEYDIAHLQPISYVENGDNIPFYGFIAEQVQAVDPLLTLHAIATTTIDGHTFLPGDPNNVDYPHMTAVIVKYLQDQKLNTQKPVRSVEENWQWFAIGILFLIFMLQQRQINKLKKK